jgi:hypothetical protein
MGGGGGGGDRNIGDISRLVADAKRALGQERRNVFISFAYEDIDEVNLLRGQSKNELSEIAFNDWSVPEAYNSESASYIKMQITDRINRSSVTVIYLSEDTFRSQWVEWEVRRSKELGKNVIATHKGDLPPAKLPKFINEFNIKIVPWSGLSVELKPQT